MDKLEAMRMYVQVVESQGFIRAAEIMGTPRSTVSRVIKELEIYLGIQLLQRTTRTLSVTPDGQRYYHQCKRLLGEISAMESSFPGRSGQPKGRLKVGMPQSLARNSFLPVITDFLSRYPEVELMLCSDDRLVDLVQEGYDCAIRTGTLEDSTTLVARPLARFRWCVVGSPAYLARHGKPDTLQQLDQHQAVGYLDHRTGRTTEWYFNHHQASVSIRMKETLVVDDTDAYIQAGIQGIGLIRVASYLVDAYLEKGQLVSCLEHYAADLPLSLVYPQSHHIPPAIRAFYQWSKSVLTAQ